MTKIWFYFGLVGTASIAMWVAAALLALIYICARRNAWLARAAFALAIVGWILSGYNSDAVNLIQSDPGVPDAVQSKDEMLETAKQRKNFAVHFAEDSHPEQAAIPTQTGEDNAKPGDAKTPAAVPAVPGATGVAGTSAASGGGAATKPAFDFHSMGKQSREGGHLRADADETPAAATQAAPSDASLPTGRMLPAADVTQANLYDRWNLLFARSMVWVAITLLVVDYFRRFKRTFDDLAPLPAIHFAIPGIALLVLYAWAWAYEGGAFVPFWLTIVYLAALAANFLLAKSRAIYVRGPVGTLLAPYLTRAVQKGETFIYLGPADPLPIPALPRTLLPHASPTLDKIAFNTDPAAAGAIPDPAYAFDAAWFGRAAVVACGPANAGALFRQALTRLKGRTRLDDPAPKTVNLVCDTGALPSAEILARLPGLCRSCNFRLLVIAPDPLPESIVGGFDEVYDSAAKVGFKTPLLSPLFPLLDRIAGVTLKVLAVLRDAGLTLIDGLFALISAPILRKEAARTPTHK